MEYKVTTSSNGRSVSNSRNSPRDGRVRERVDSASGVLKLRRIPGHSILCRLGGGGGVVRYRGRVKGDLGVSLDVSTPRQRPSQ